MDLIDLGIHSVELIDGSSSEDNFGPIKTELANELNIRPLGIKSTCLVGVEMVPCYQDDMVPSNFNVTVFYNHNPTISLA
jgi:hypothetical protein